MEKKLIILNETVDSIMDKLRPYNIDINSLNDVGIILPESSEESEQIFNQFTPDFKAYLSDHGVKVTVIKNNEIPIKYNVIQSADIILPTIIFIGKGILLSIATKVMASYIYDNYISKRIKAPSVQLDIISAKSEEAEYKQYKISGNADDVVKILNSIAENEERLNAKN